MAIVLKLKKGESVERGLKRLKKVLDKEGLIKKLRDNRYFEKPCVKARKKSLTEIKAKLVQLGLSLGYKFDADLLASNK